MYFVTKMYVKTFVCLLICGKALDGQRIGVEEFSNTFSSNEIPIREPPSQFKFIKDRTPENKRIIGGDVATPHEYPFQVALYIYVYVTQYFCGGSLITPQWVLTAAHCVEWATNIVVVLGVHDISAQEDSRVAYNTSTYIVHEDWSSYYLINDVALIRLPERVNLSDYINTVPIAYGSNLYTGQTSKTLGWGLTIAGTYSDVLRYVEAPVISNDECKAVEQYATYIMEGHICTSGVGIVGSCNGDSGGPIIVDGTQVGLVSFGVSDCAAGLPSVNTRLTEFYSWVNGTIAEYEAIDEPGAGRKIKSTLLFSAILTALIVAMP